MVHGQAVIADTRVPASVILDCIAAGMTAEEITTECPTVTVTGVRAAAADGARPRGLSAPAAAVSVKFKLEENLPASSAILISAGHHIDTVTQQGLIGALDEDVVATTTAAAAASAAEAPVE
jgi:hypothetical protein